MKWVIGQGCPMDEGTCEHAALGGHLECLKWLRSQGCPWDKSTTSAAAQGGHLDCVEWAKSNCCPTDQIELHSMNNSIQLSEGWIVKVGALVGQHIV